MFAAEARHFSTWNFSCVFDSNLFPHSGHGSSRGATEHNDDVAEGAVDVADGGPKKDDIPSDDAGTSAIVMIFFRALDLGEFVSSLGERAVRNFFLLPPAGGTN